jgi:2-keto-4-pentenoate hydratase/2-oxohepta-3-ene-1,7-dioic acid hydratase in catechol pathway
MDEIEDPYDIWVTCSVNGEQRMRVNTSDQIWKLPDIIEHFSRLVPLEPGDMFSTGTPGGVAVGKPNAEDLYVKPGAVVECAFEKPASSQAVMSHVQSGRLRALAVTAASARRQRRTSRRWRKPVSPVMRRSAGSACLRPREPRTRS